MNHAQNKVKKGDSEVRHPSQSDHSGSQSHSIDSQTYWQYKERTKYLFEKVNDLTNEEATELLDLSELVVDFECRNPEYQKCNWDMEVQLLK